LVRTFPCSRFRPAVPLPTWNDLDNHPDPAWRPRNPMERYLLVEAHKNHGRAGLQRMHEQLTAMPEQLRRLIGNEEQFNSRPSKKTGRTQNQQSGEVSA
jgi:hypothetical protein